MAHAKRLRLRDLREIYLLVGECRELGSDPLVWRRHMLERMRGLVGAQVAIGGEARKGNSQWEGRMVDLGWPSDEQRAVYQQWLFTHGPDENPFSVGMFSRNGRLVTHYRRQLVDDDAWYGCEFGQMLCGLGIDDMLGTYFRDTRDCLHMVAFHRRLASPPFTDRERCLLHLFQREVMSLTGSVLATFERPTVAELSRRSRQTLFCLLQGDSEKQAALRLGITTGTLHQHVKQLHRHFGVSSRGELLSHCIGLFPVLSLLEQRWDQHFTAVNDAQ